MVLIRLWAVALLFPAGLAAFQFSFSGSKDAVSSVPCPDRRKIHASILSTVFSGFVVEKAFASNELSLDDYVYKCARVSEAIGQEIRLIKSGKYKTIQRANVKLAVRFMIQNYRLADAVNQSSAYLQASSQMKALSVGQAAVQNLQTILEYFDSSDVENIKISGGGLGSKEEIVLRGLETANLNLKEFISYFPSEVVSRVEDKVKKENELNEAEFDPALGSIVNISPTK